MVRTCTIIALALASFCAAALAQTGPAQLSSGSPPFLQRGPHVIANGAAPAATSCGTGPVVKGNDFSGHVTTGAGATACTLTFATAYSERPSCVVSAEAFTAAYAVTTSGIAVGAALAGSRIHWNCVAQPGG